MFQFFSLDFILARGFMNMYSSCPSAHPDAPTPLPIPLRLSYQTLHKHSFPFLRPPRLYMPFFSHLKYHPLRLNLKVVKLLIMNLS